MLFFDRAGAAKYRSATPLARAFSTLSVSLGTNSANDKNWLAWGAKINLYRQHDPLNDDEFLKALDAATLDSKDTFLLAIKDLEKEQIMLDRRSKDYDRQMDALDDSIANIQFTIRERERQQSQRLAEAREKYIQEHWNASFLDVAFGRLQTYTQTDKPFSQVVSDPVTGRDTTLSFSNKSLELQSQGYGVWVSGGIGLGHDMQLSGMARYGKRPSDLTGELTTLASMGFNLRYGTRRYNFFVEGFLDHATDALTNFGEAAITRKVYMMTFGGDWRFSRNVMLSFGIRQTRDFETGTYFLQPLINVNCLMR